MLREITTFDRNNVSIFLGLKVRNPLLDFWAQLLKRCVDILASFFGLLLLAPLLGSICLLIKFDERGRIFYRQQRLGRDGRPFTMVKFRTMHLNADQFLTEKLALDPKLKEEWDRFQKLRKDPRITRVGGFLRKFSLDELPQLWNILKGEMSLVGPRPILADQRNYYGASYNEYVQVTPGMTGLWQVSGRNGTTFARRVELDKEYIQRWSVWLEVYILVKTITVVIWPEGAY